MKIDSSGNEVMLVFCDEYLSHLQGRILTIIEAMGVPQAQEKSVKDLIRDAIWDDAHDGWSVPLSREEWDEFCAKQTSSK